MLSKLMSAKKEDKIIGIGPGVVKVCHIGCPYPFAIPWRKGVLMSPRSYEKRRAN